jgi:hypothetical protein
VGNGAFSVPRQHHSRRPNRRPDHAPPLKLVSDGPPKAKVVGIFPNPDYLRGFTKERCYLVEIECPNGCYRGRGRNRRPYVHTHGVRRDSYTARGLPNHRGYHCFDGPEGARRYGKIPDYYFVVTDEMLDVVDREGRWTA